MPLTIRNPRAQALVRELAATTGETMTAAVVTALEERLARLRAGADAARAERVARIMAHGRAFAALPVLDSRPTDELLAYDEVGLPG